MSKIRKRISLGLAGLTLVIVLTFALGAEALLQTSYAEPAHNLFMLLMRGAGHESLSRLHGGATSGGSSEQETSANMNQSMIANNILGRPAGMAAGGLAAVTVMSAIPLALVAFILSRNHRSYGVAGLLAASGIILMILPLTNMNFAFPGPIIGVAVGLGILGLGTAKGISTSRAIALAPT